MCRRRAKKKKKLAARETAIINKHLPLKIITKDGV